MEVLRGVGEGHDGETTLRRLNRHRDVRDGKRRAVAADEPVEVAPDGFTGGGRQAHWTVGDALIAERRRGGWVREQDPAFGIHHADRLCGLLQDCSEKLARPLFQAGQLGARLSARSCLLGATHRLRQAWTRFIVLAPGPWASRRCAWGRVGLELGLSFGLRYGVRSASDGARRAALTAGYSPAIAPIATAPATAAATS
jgi:hypothetical protein